MGMIDFAPLFRPTVGYDQLLDLLAAHVPAERLRLAAPLEARQVVVAQHALLESAILVFEGLADEVETMKATRVVHRGRADGRHPAHQRREGLAHQ